MKHHEFYIEGDYLINRAFELINGSVKTRTNLGDFYFFSLDIISIENPIVREDRDIISVLTYHGLVENLGIRSIDNHSDCHELFALTVLAIRFRENKSKFKGWIMQAEIERKKEAERKRSERNEPIRIGVRGAIYAASIGAVVGALCGFGLSQLNHDNVECNVNLSQCGSASSPPGELSSDVENKNQ